MIPVRTLLLLSLAAIGHCQTVPLAMRPPIAVSQSGAYGDGGTLAVLLSDAGGQELWVVASGDGWEDQIPPDGTLFLDAGHHRWIAARLPDHREEYDRVVKLLRLAVSSNPPVEAAEADEESPVPWDFDIVESVLSKLEAVDPPAVFTPGQTPAPDWYADFSASRRLRYEKSQANRRRYARFKSFYPAAAQACFENDDQEGWATFKPEGVVAEQGAEAEESPEDRAIRLRAERIAHVVGDAIDLAEVNCRAFGLIGGRPRGWSFSELVAEASMKSVSPEAFLLALDRIQGDRSALVGAGAFFFEPRFRDALPEAAARRWAPLVMDAVLGAAADHNKEAIVDDIAALDYPWAADLLTQIADGDVELSAAEQGKWSREEPGLRASALLALAMRGDDTIRDRVRERLEAALSDADRAAMEVCLALLGEPERLRSAHFKFGSNRIGLGAVRVIEQHGGRHGVDLLFTVAIDHGYRRVRDEALEVAERLTGQNFRTTWPHRDEAKAWWAEHGDEFQQRLRSANP